VTGTERPVGVVLAGGESKRFGSQKAAAEIDGTSLENGALRRLREVCTHVTLADRGRSRAAGGAAVGTATVGDGPGRGPAAGILGAAAAYPGRSLLVLACDLPGVTVDLLAHLSAVRDCDWYLPRHSIGVEPLCAFYGRSALAALARRVENGAFALQGLLEEPLRRKFLEGDELAAFGDPAELFLNVNTPADLARLRG